MAAGPASLVDLLRESARRFPERPAILQRGAAVSYGELWRGVCRAANALRVAPNVRDTVMSIKASSRVVN